MLSRNVRPQFDNRSLSQSTRAQIRAQHLLPRHASSRAIAREADSQNSGIKRTFWWLMSAAITVALLIALSANRASAQSRPSTTGEGPGHAFTINPFFVLAGWISGEYEQRVNESFTLGAGASYVDFSDNRYSSVDVKARLYPVGHAMRGFEMGLGIGFTNIDTDTDRDDCKKKTCTGDEKFRITTPAVSIEFGHQWTLGENRRTMLAVGGGGKRFLANIRDVDDTPRVIPFFRVGIGYAW